jgi:ribosomal protein S18 acetylase RimI-like enzyme
MYHSVYPPQNILLRFIRAALRRLHLRSGYFGHILVMKKKIGNDRFNFTMEGFEFSQAGEKDIQYIINHSESTRVNRYSQRLSNDHTCYCVKQDGKVVGYQWIEYDFCRVNFATDREVDFFPLKRGQAFLYDIFIFRESRRSGVAYFLGLKTFSELENQKIQELFVNVSVGNIASIALLLKSGFEPIRMVYYYGFSRWKKIFTGRDNTKRMKEWENYFRNRLGKLRER